MQHAWRLTFAYDGDDFILKSTRRLAKRVPPGQTPQAGRAGRFIEVRGPGRQVLYSRAITQLVPDTVEYRTGDPTRPLARVASRGRQEVSILVPDLPEGRSVAIVATGRSGGRTEQTGSATGAPRDLFTADLPHEGEAT